MVLECAVVAWERACSAKQIQGDANMASISGGCLCGKVRYSADVDPVFTGICHCRNCQKESGSAFTTVVAVPQPALSVEGDLKTYTDKRDSGQAMFPRLR